MVKSEVTVNCIEVVWVIDPLMASTVTLYGPEGVEALVVIVTMHAPAEPGEVIVRVPVFRAAAKLWEEGVAVSRMLPVKPKLFTVSVALEDPLARNDEGEA